MPIGWIIVLGVIAGCLTWVNFKVNKIARHEVYYPDGKTPYFTDFHLVKTRCKCCGGEHA